MRRPPPRAMVLAAGLGTRLRPLTNELPKPLVPVANRPLVSYQLALLRRAGVHQAALNLHHLGKLIPPALAGENSCGLEITYSPEQTILGTGGGLVRLHEFLRDDTFFLLNGDVLCDLDLGRVLRFHRERRACATMVVRPLPAGGPYTALGLDERQQLVQFKDVTRPARGRVRQVMFCGLHVLEPTVFDFLPASGFSCINDQGYRAMLAAGLPVAGYAYRGPWFDLGTPADYLRANLEIASGRFRPSQLDPPPGDEWRDGVLWGREATAAPGSRVGPQVILGAGARVDGGAEVSQAVLWPGARATAGARLQRAVVTPVNVLAEIPPEALRPTPPGPAPR